MLDPYTHEESLSFTLKRLSMPYEWYADSENLGGFAPGDSFTITLPGLGSAYIRLSVTSV
jgi:hypothetical protein